MAEKDVIGVMDEPVASETSPGQRPAERLPADGRQEEPAPLAQDLAASIGDAANLDMLMDVSLKVTVELGRTQMKFRDILNLANGSLIELNNQTSEPVDIMVNGALLATGEVVVIDDHFAVRINRLLSRVERLQRVV
jgi:flagellar motor switch protein FliN/FliY